MKWSKIAACYYPTTVVLVDDNSKHLNKLRLLISAEHSYTRLFSTPESALTYLKNYKREPFIKQCAAQAEETHFNQPSIDINIRSIRNTIYNPDRFNEISVLVVDYAMPGLNGIELCKQLKNAPYKKLMLTGEADESLAVKAFNEGLIDKFIRKDELNFEKVLNESIHELQQKYFIELSQIVIASLTKNTGQPLSAWLNEPSFIELFNNIWQENKQSEYYLTDTFGSYMFLDFTGKPSWLAVKCEEGMRSAVEVAEYADNVFPSYILDGMKNKKLLLYSDQEDHFCSDPMQAEKCLHPATQLKGDTSDYYYAYISNSLAYDIVEDKVYSFKAYRENNARSDKEIYGVF